MSYGKVISGGASMRKGVTKGINDKLKTHDKQVAHRENVAAQVVNAFKVRNLSNQATNDVHNGDKFKKGTVPSKV